jgi:2-methylcitrate dehydratase PrpD
MDAIEALIDNVVHTRFDDLPESAVEGARRSILDAFATTIAGSSAPGVAEVLDVLKHWGGREEATVALFGNRLPAYHAVMANVLMCHALEIDDSHYPAIVHPTAPTLWAALATCEQSNGARGDEFLCAIVLGIDAMARIALSAPATLDNGYHTAIYSGFGAAVTAGKLRRLPKAALHDALGIVFARAAASVQAGSDGALVKRMQPAFNASEAIRAVEFASRGITGIRNVLEGQFGVGRLFNHAPLNKTLLLDGLGERFLASELTTKRYPTSRCAHGPIEATLSLVRQHDIEASEVVDVTVSVQESCHKRESRPFDPSEGTPQVKAQFSIDYCVAAALLWRDVFIREMQIEQIMDPAVLSLARHVHVRQHAVVGRTQYLPVHVAIKTRRDTFQCEISSLKGSPEDPLSWAEIVDERLERCLRYSAVTLPRGNVEALVSLCRRIEQMDDARALVKLLNPSASEDIHDHAD